jgi:hypothetical protein
MRCQPLGRSAELKILIPNRKSLPSDRKLFDRSGA